MLYQRDGKVTNAASSQISQRLVSWRNVTSHSCWSSMLWQMDDSGHRLLYLMLGPSWWKTGNNHMWPLEICHWRWSFVFQKPTPFLITLSLCLGLVDQDVGNQLLLQGPRYLIAAVTVMNSNPLQLWAPNSTLFSSTSCLGPGCLITTRKKEKELRQVLSLGGW